MRLQKLREMTAADNLDGFLITQPENRRYLSGFTGSNGVLIITHERQVLATDSRYYTQVSEQCPTWELAEVGYDFAGAMLELLRGLGLGARRVGFEAQHLTVSNLHAWERALLGRLILVNTQSYVEELRIRKDAQEMAQIRRAVEIADQAYAHVGQWIQPGMTEQQVAWELESFMRTHGAEALSFEPIVASGPNAAKPHAVPTDRKLQTGEPVIMDFGCVVNGYCSDITRTICLGQPADETYLNIWNTVLRAQQAAISGITGSATGESVDKLARDLIKEAGYGDNFGHGLGHSLGLAVHENPRYSFTYSERVPTDAIMTVEPGIYLPGWGGVRLEDIVRVTDNGADVLTAAPKIAVV